MVAEEQLHIGVSEELAELGRPGSFDSLDLSGSGPDKRKLGEEGRGEGLAWASCGMQGWRESMEDVALMLPFGYLGGAWRQSALFGVFDGHGGEQVARYAARKLPVALAGLQQEPEKALAAGYLQIDEWLRKPEAAAELRELTLPNCEVRDSPERCGCTAVCCLVKGDKLAVANTGDSRGVLCRKGRAVPLSEDHKPELPRETARIEAAGGFVQEEALWGGRGLGYRVNGELNLSRALGDHLFKDFSKRPEEHMVSAVPDTQTLKWTPGEDEFLLLACDGVWECISNQEAVNFVRSRLPPPGGGGKRKLVPVLEQLLDSCIANHPTQRGGLGCDNMTAVLVRFEDPQAVAAAAATAAEEEASEQAAANGHRPEHLDMALSETIARLSSRRRLRETAQEKETRMLQEMQEKREREKREKEELLKRLERKRLREEREELEKLSGKRKRTLCCAADEGEEEGAEDSGFEEE